MAVKAYGMDLNPTKRQRRAFVASATCSMQIAACAHNAHLRNALIRDECCNMLRSFFQTVVLAFALSLLPNALVAQSSQNPSLMVEHPRLEKIELAGERSKLSLGTLFIPAKLAATKKSLP